MQAEKKMLILGDMRELGKDSAEEHQRIVDYLEEYGFEDVILVGELFCSNPPHVYHLSRCSGSNSRAPKEQTLRKDNPDKRLERNKTEYGSRLSLICRFTHHSWFQYETSHQ